MKPCVPASSGFDYLSMELEGNAFGQIPLKSATMACPLQTIIAPTAVIGNDYVTAAQFLNE